MESYDQEGMLSIKATLNVPVDGNILILQSPATELGATLRRTTCIIVDSNNADTDPPLQAANFQTTRLAYAIPSWTCNACSLDCFVAVEMQLCNMLDLPLPYD